MNPRQRFGLLLVILAAVGALAVFVTASRLIGEVKSEVGPLVPVLALKNDVAAHEPVDPSLVQTVLLPKRWISPTSLNDTSQLMGKVAGTDLSAGSYLQRDMLTNRPELQPGDREIAILINAETGVAGKIDPGSRVDIFATFAGSERQPPRSRIIVPAARVIDVGKMTTVDDAANDAAPSQVVPITFALPPLDAQRVAYAESFATKVRLAIVAPGSNTDIELDERTYQLETDSQRGGTRLAKGGKR